MGAPNSLRAQPTQPCFAFLLRADVHVVCEGRKDQITHRRDVGSFAISDEQTAFAFLTDKTTKVSGPVGVVISTTTIIDLKSMRSSQLRGDNSLVNTCGGIFWMASPMRDRSDPRDLITGREIAPPYKWFRCSSDRSVVVGTTDSSGRDLYRGPSAQVKVAEPGAFSRWTFNISPDGHNIAYFTDTKPLCAVLGSGPAQCVAGSAVVPERPSINNSGEVLVTIETPDDCFYRSMTDFSPAPANRSNDICIGIGYWNPAIKTIQLLEQLGRAPQWIAPATARLLRNWSASRRN